MAKVFFGLIFIVVGFSAPAQDGEALAKLWCSSCHSFPEPQLLDKSTWIELVLPEMGARLGFQKFRDGDVRPSTETPDGIYPAEPLIDGREWENIIFWYESKAPDALTLPVNPVRDRLTLFSVETPPKGKGELPVATAIMIDETMSRLLVADSGRLDLAVYSPELVRTASIRAVGVISGLAESRSGGVLATVIGENIGQTEELRGLLIEIAVGNELLEPPNIERLARRLHRPVDVVSGDFNGDGRIDYVIGEFGSHYGKLSLHLGQADGSLRVVELLNEAGAVSVDVVGEDLWVLMAQGDERIVRFRRFASEEPVVSEVLLRFPPSQGSSSMTVLDFNGDGVMDILYTAGDNADISPVFKPYHGVYLFEGQADGAFLQTMFFHLDGATSAVAEDFDQDGDLDFAAIAYFANFDRARDEAGFVYLENTESGFAAKRVAGLGALGRFVAMTAGDIDGDGDKDIALANLSIGPSGPTDISPALRARWTGAANFVLLRNLLH